MMLSSFCLFLTFIAATRTQFTTVAIVATNDIHGSAFPTQMERSDTGERYSYGGLAYMGGIIDIIKAEYPDHTIFLDAGDQFQGGIESSKLISSGKIMNDFYAALDLNASAIGNHEFDFGPQFLLPYMSSKGGTNLAANIRSQTGDAVFLPKQKISKLIELTSGIRIGIIGLSTKYTPETTSAFAQKKFPAYKFLEYRDLVVAESKVLRNNGADAVLILGHLGDSCDANETYGIWTKDTVQPSCVADEASNLIDALPQGTIDGILQGHRHRFAHNFHKGIPYMGSINGGYYFNVLYLRFSKRQVISATIEGPIPVCERIFANTGTCGYMSKDRIATAGPLMEWKFHNKVVRPNAKVQAIYTQQWLPKMQPYFAELARNQIYLESLSDEECELANLITNLMHAAVPYADFIILNMGSLRTIWLPGILQYQHFYNMLPFDNELVTFDMTGDQLLKTLQTIQAGPLGFYQAYGLKQTVTLSPKRALINATMLDGNPILPQQTYRGLVTDFLLGGGDDFKDVMGKIYTVRNSRNQGQIRELLKPKLEELAQIKAGSLIDPDNPRLIVV